MLNKKSINLINAHIKNLLNYATSKIDLEGIDNIKPIDIDLIEINTCAVQEDLQLAYINNQLDKISFYNVLYWQKLLAFLEKNNYPYLDLLKAGLQQLLIANGFSKADAGELVNDRNF